jgi:UDP-glucose 4-epimerase
MKKFLCTGGAGFIASTLATRLLNDGHQVYIVDNLTTGDYHNIPDGAVFLSTSIMGLKDHKDIKFDGIFHLGAPSSSPILRKDQYLISDTIREFIFLLGLAREQNIKMVYASSSSIYNGCPVPSREDMVITPTDFYTEVRLIWERIAKVYNDFYGTQTVGLRLFSVYGPHEEYKKQYANLITQMIWAKNKGEVFEIYGDGEQRRDATFVTDVVDAFILAMGSSIKYDVVNVGTGKNYSLNQVAKMIGVKTKYVPVPFKNYVSETLANTTKATNLLGFTSKVSLEVGIRLLTGGK